jgi:hypothetical protein
MSTASTLQTVAMACATVADHLNDMKNEHPHTLRKITAVGEPNRFFFSTIVQIDGEDVEVRVFTP